MTGKKFEANKFKIKADELAVGSNNNCFLFFSKLDI